MAFTQNEFEAILGDSTKFIEGDIRWGNDEDHSPSLEFRVEVGSDPGFPLFVRGSYNPLAEKLTFALIHKGAGRIYALDLGSDHHNPDCNNVGEKHKHSWTDQHKDKQAYVPGDITTSAADSVTVWGQFCVEAKITHRGKLLAVPAELFP